MSITERIKSLIGRTRRISTEELISKLQNLPEYMPGESWKLYDFGAYLATTLEPDSKLNPDEFSVAASLALRDLRTGKAIDPENPERYASLSSLCQESLMVRMALGYHVPRIVEAICPSDFAKEIEKRWVKPPFTISHPKPL